MEIKNQEELAKKIRILAGKKLKQAVDSLIAETINDELPEKQSSTIAKDLYSRRRLDVVSVYISSPVWDYLDKGTGIYSSAHPGKGPGGLIIPYKQKRSKGGKFTSQIRGVLHFKNAEIAAALGFKDENVFLKSVKGIKPRWIFDRHFSPKKIADATKKAQAKD
jgi:hypothetical protein